jgi:isopenicillin N synthase-like dioxygenase
MKLPEDFVIPTVDIGPYLADPETEAAAKIIRDVRQACMTTGFFSLVGHGIPRELQDRVFEAARTLFALPLEQKKTLVSSVLKNRGYEIIGSQALQEGTLPDLKEVCVVVLSSLDQVLTEPYPRASTLAWIFPTMTSGPRCIRS